MVAGKSPEWLPPGFAEKLKYKNGRKIKYYLDVATGKKYHSKKDLLCAIEDIGKLVTPQKENAVDNGLSDNKSDVTSVRTNDTPAWFPDGWRVEERTRQTGSSQGSVYKVYIETSSGRKFYSKASVTRYLGGLNHVNAATVQNKIDNVDVPTVDMSLQLGSLTNTDGNDDINKPNVNEPTVDMSPQLVSMTNTDDINNVVKPNADESTLDMSPQLVSMTNNDINNVVKPNVDEPSMDISPELASMTNTGRINKRKRKDSAFVMVSIDCTTDNDLPPGWIKEIKTSKCGNKTRKDPYYTDPVSGYVFRSKLDALRFLKTKDIGSCACRPLKRELDNMKLIEDEILSTNPANEKLLGGESNGGEESSGTKGLLPEAQAKISKQKQEYSESDSLKITSVIYQDISRDNSEKNAEMTKNPEPENVSKEDTSLAVDIAIVSPVTEPLTKQHLSENGNITKVNSRKSKKRRDLSLPLRTSKRLAGSQTVMASNSDFNERSLRAALRKSSGSEVNKSPSSALNSSISIHLPGSQTVESNPDFNERSLRAALRKSSGIEVNKSPSSALNSSISIQQPGSQPVESNSDFNERSLRAALRKSSGSEVNKSPSSTLNASISIPLPSAGRGNLPGSQPVMASNSAFNGRSLRAALRKSSGSEVNKSPSSTLNASISIPLPSDGRGNLPGSQPVMASNSASNERSLRAALRKSSGSEVNKSPSSTLNASIGIPLPSDIEPRKEATEQAFTVEESLQYSLEEIQKLFNEVEDPPTEGPAMPEEQSGGEVDKSKISEETPIFYDFGESWSDPLKFAVKTLMGDLSMNDSLTFPSCLNEQQNGTQAGGCLQQPQTDAPNNFQTAFASRSESSRQHGAVDQLPPISSSFSSLENIGFPSFGGFTCQSSTEVGKKDSQTKFNP